ncbi:MAG: peptidoglycan-binding protein [Candidatus Pacebacteria bacterium]|nr:peptidoglycan-binding protein [Candidatus Paceibacterota bacterium]
MLNNKKHTKKYVSIILLIAFMLPVVVFAQTEATVSKTITKYTGVKNVDSKVIKKSSDSNSLNVLLQVGLTNAGYNPGEPDGVVGTKTIQAIKNLQKDFGISADGVFGANTATALRIFSDRFPNQKVSQVKNILPEEFTDFKSELKQSNRQVKVTKNDLVGVTKLQLPTTPKGVLTYVLSKNQPGAEEYNNSSSVVGSLVSSLTKKPKLNTSSTRSTDTNIINPGGVSNSSSSVLDTNFGGSSAAANSTYTCVTTSEHTEQCTATPLPGESSSNSYYCRGSNCEVLGLSNRPTESVEEYAAPTNIDRSIDFNEVATFGEPVVFDKKTGQPIIFLKDYGYDPKNGKRNLSVIFVDLAK